MHAVVKDRWAARGQQHHLFVPVSGGVFGNEGPTTLKCPVSLVIPGIVLQIARTEQNRTEQK
jgi:hypothetical protein